VCVCVCVCVCVYVCKIKLSMNKFLIFTEKRFFRAVQYGNISELKRVKVSNDILKYTVKNIYNFYNIV